MMFVDTIFFIDLRYIFVFVVLTLYIPIQDFFSFLIEAKPFIRFPEYYSILWSIKSDL